jgi:tetratricopeptide (TPR) repeat protein
MHDKEITLFTDGLKHAQDEFFLDSISEFKLLVDEFPDSELADDALYNIGLCYFNMHQFEKSISFFEKVINDYPDGTISILDGGNEFGKTAAKCHYAIVNCHLAMSNIDKAKENVLLSKNFPDSYVLIDEVKKSFSDLSENAISTFLNMK